MTEHQTLMVGLGERAYDIRIEARQLAHAGERVKAVMLSTRAIIITDSHVGPLYAGALEANLRQAGITVDTLSVRAGEASKSFDSYQRLMEELLALKPDRKTTLIALGGGVVGDLCGFAAATLLRGVPFVQIPTSLLAMVDSSVGGKTGINSAHGKNLIGAFYQPKLVLIDPDVLGTLPERELKAGYAEVVKYGALGDAEFFAWLEANGPAVLTLEAAPLTHAIHHCCLMKAKIVAKDEREAGMRALLNLGHTFGHALEAEVGYDGRLLHGEAVSIGMVMAARLSAAIDLCHTEDADRIEAHLAQCGLMTSPKDVADMDWDADAICRHFASDKKAEAGTPIFVLLESLGYALTRGAPAEAAHKVVADAIA